MELALDGEEGRAHELNGALQVMLRLLGLLAIILHLGRLAQELIELPLHLIDQLNAHFLQYYTIRIDNSILRQLI